MRNPRKSLKGSGIAGVSVVEMFLTVAVIGILATLSTLAVTHVNRSAQHRKLETDVQTLNSAIRVYLATGGSLQGISHPAGVLAKLKTSRSRADKELHVGAPSGRMIDPRVAAVPVEESWKLRAVYNAGGQRFDVEKDAPGVEFVLDENLAEAASLIESRSHGAVRYAENSGWVWDHGPTNNPNAPKGPSSFKTNPGVADSDPGSVPVDPDAGAGDEGGPPSPPPPPQPPRLPTPAFDLPAGAHAEGDFPLLVAITNVPPADDADPIYRLGTGPWTPYTGPVSVPMNTRLRAQFLTKDPEAYRDGPEKSAHFYPVPESLSGGVDGNFHSPVGGPNLTYQITHQGDRFAHGDPVFILDGEPINSGDPSILHFSSLPFSNVAPGQKFKLGDLHYHNGSSFYDSHATAVKLAIRIEMPDRGEVVQFDLSFDLVNTPNDPDDAQASADYVKINNLTQNISLEINGVRYRMKLEFGATDSFGFSSQSQFHVYEGATGQGELLATFLPR